MVQCYFYRSDTNIVTPFEAGITNQCASGKGCCNVGTYCLSNGICQVPGPVAPGYTGYFMGSCSDPTFSDPSCPKQCTSLPNPDVAYNSTTGEWACCGVDANGKVNCEAPTVQDFSGPAPSDLSTIGFVPTTSTAASSSSSTSSSVSSPHTTSRTTNSASTSSHTSSAGTVVASSSSQVSSATQTPAAANNTNTGVSTGTVVGIAVGVALGVVLLCAIAAFFFFRRRRNTRQQNASPNSHVHNEKMTYQPVMAPTLYGGPQAVHEVSGSEGPRYEKSASGNATRVELEAR